MTMALILHDLVKQHLTSLIIQILVVGEGGHLDIVVTEVVDINKFWINARTTGAREKVMDCMDLFHKIEGKDMYVEKVLTGSMVAAQCYEEGYHRAKVISAVKDIIL